MAALSRPAVRKEPERFEIYEFESPGLKQKGNTGKGTEHKQRIVLVSPYASFNFMFEHVLGKISREGNAELDVVSTADSSVEPYVNVSAREKKKESLPSCVIDFSKLGVKTECGFKMVKFDDYWSWTIETVKSMQDLRTRYLLPHLNGELLARSSEYPLGREFDPYSFRVSDLAEKLTHDIACIVNRRDEGFYLFAEAVMKDKS